MSIFSIQRMNKDDIQLAIEWAARQGWNPGLSDANCFYSADPNGFFIGKLDNKPVAVGAAVVYDDNYAFCGLYIVDSQYRGHGYGLQLTKARLDYVGNRLTGLDGVIHMIDKYSRLGYAVAHRNNRYVLNDICKFKLNSKVIDLAGLSFQDILEYDRRYFPALRPYFLKTWIQQPESFALGYMNNEKLCGYGVIRKCFEGYRIGPLFADTVEMAEALFQALLTKARHPPFFIDIPEPNTNSNVLIQKYNMQRLFSTMRMYRNGRPKLLLGNIYGITTLELG